MALGPWSYNPSPAAALLFAILFGIATIYHIFIVFRRHVWHFLPLVVGGGCMFQLPSQASLPENITV